MTMPGAPFHVVVIGGGLGGLCLAQGLRAAGVSVAVYERDRTPTERAGRYRIHVNPAGSRALHECLPPQLWEIFLRSAADAGAGCGFVTEQLRELVVVDQEVMTGGRSEPSAGHHAVSRAVLRHLLLAGLRDAVHFGKRFERFERRDDGRVTAVFADGTSATGDVLVGADGANSRTRQQYLPHAGRVETGAVAVAGKLPLTDAARAWLPEMLRSRLNTVFPPRHFLFTAVFDRSKARASASGFGFTDAMVRAVGLDPAVLFEGEHDDDYAFWTFIADRGAYPGNPWDLDGPGLRRLVGGMIDGWHPALRRLVAESDPGSMMLTSLKSSVPVAPWATTNVTLLGDAIHSMSPAGGIGGNTALRDASLLAGKLAAVHRGELPLRAAIEAYESEMLGYGFGAVREALRNTRLAITTNRLARTAARTWFGLCGAVPTLKRLTFGNVWTENTAPKPARAAAR
jgi:2-polyprenyl-6-methoxyphenol hydroxylase-like FAD-dependent oxidoreductase